MFNPLQSLVRSCMLPKNNVAEALFAKSRLVSGIVRPRFEFESRTIRDAERKHYDAATYMPAQSQLQGLVDSIDRDRLADPPVELLQFAKEETFQQQGGQERRRFRRYSLITNVIVVPLDEDHCPVGAPFVALSSGMSVDGLRLIHTQPAPSKHLFIEIDGQPVQFVLSVLRNRAIGSCFEIAGRLTKPAALRLGGEIASGAPDRSLPTQDDLLHWAGVTAAVQLLSAARNGCGC
jgi:hypothetical protein